MKTSVLIFACTLLLTACGDDDPDFLRSANGISTNNISVYISAEAHTHIHQDVEPDETHTTLEVEFYGYDNDGYYYTIELSDQDELSVTVDGAETTVIPGKPIPPTGDKFYVEYLEDFDAIAPGTEFMVNLDRNVDAAIHSTSVVLHEETPITATPVADSEISLDDEITLEWEANEDFEYRMYVALYCDVLNNHPLEGRIRFPGYYDSELTSPFTFIPSDYFSLPDNIEIVSCELRTSLFTDMEHPEPTDSPYNSIIIRTSRENVVEYSIQLE